MKVLTYVNGVLTVIKEDEFFKDSYPKPSFILGNDFYYEPTLMQTQNRNLTPTECSQALEFINNFTFPKIEIYNPKEVYCVDKYGNYIGQKIIGQDEFEVPCAPKEIKQGIVWDFEANEWYESILVDERNGLILGTGLNLFFNNSIYVRASLLNNEYCIGSQKYDFITGKIFIDFNLFREKKYEKLKNDFSILVYEKIGSNCAEEVNSWVVQEDEARAWNTDTSSLTPLIDALLMGRNMGETKEDLVVKIIAKADAYKAFYGQLLGKFHAKQKEVESASTIEELKAIVW